MNESEITIKMEQIKVYLNSVVEISKSSLKHFPVGQDATIRYIFCGIEKISKTSIAILNLYSQVGENRDLEFPLGILIRSLMMDMILTLKLKSVLCKLTNENISTIKQQVEDECHKLISDGTDYLIDEVFQSKNMNKHQQESLSSSLAAQFPNLFETELGRPKQKKGFKPSKIGKIISDVKQLELQDAESIKFLYFYYSKYDHLSHLTSLFARFPFEYRKRNVDLSIILIGKHLKELLAIGHDMNADLKILKSNIEQLTSLIQDLNKT